MSFIINPYFFSVSSFDADAEAFFNRVTAAGGTLSNTEKNATNQLVLDLKTNGIWSDIQAIYPMVGASSAACSQNLKSASFIGSFNGGWTFASTGVTPNGTNAFFNTNFNPVTQSQAQNSFYIGLYIRTNTVGLMYDMGSTDDVITPTKITYLISRYDANRSFLGIADNKYLTAATTLNSQGFWSGGINGGTTQILYRNGSSVGTSTSSQVGFSNQNIYVGAINNSGVATFFADRQNALAFISNGLSNTQNTNLYNSVQTFQTTLSRQV
jgi:hypothetical protein